MTQVLYTRSLREATRALFDSSDLGTFFETMFATVDRNLSAAWFAGMRECGLLPNEISSQEDAARAGLITESLSRVPSLGNTIVQDKREGKPVTAIFPRLDVWANRWGEAKAIAQSTACGDRKLMWVLGVAEHCRDCLRLSGKVKRASAWAAAGIHPKMSTLECGGWNCKCSFVETDLPVSPGSIAPSLGQPRSIGLPGGLLGAGVLAVAVARARQGIAQLISGTSIGDTSINLETGHGITLGESVRITEGGREYRGTAFAVAPNVVEVDPPLDFSFSVNAVVRHRR